MGKEAIRLLQYAFTYRGWHNYGHDPKMIRALKTLVRHGFIEMNNYRQYRLVER